MCPTSNQETTRNILSQSAGSTNHDKHKLRNVTLILQYKGKIQRKNWASKKVDANKPKSKWPAMQIFFSFFSHVARALHIVWFHGENDTKRVRICFFEHVAKYTRVAHSSTILVPRWCKDVASDKLKTVVRPMDKKRVVGVLKACARNRKSKLSTLPLVDIWASCNGFVFGGVVHPAFWKTGSMLKD